MAGPKPHTVTVYGLASSADGKIRYVGQSRKPLEKRLSWHKTGARHFDAPLALWIRSLKRDGHDLLIFPIETDAVLDEAEVRLIAWYRRNGADLLNITDGGRGVSGYRQTEVHKLALRKANLGRHPSEATRKKISAAKKKMWETRPRVCPEHVRRKISKALAGRKLTPEHARKVAQAKHGRKRPPVTAETRDKLSRAAKGRIPANLAQLHAANRGHPKPPEVRAKIAAALTGRKASEAHKEKMRQSMLRLWREKKRRAAECGHPLSRKEKRTRKSRH